MFQQAYMCFTWVHVPEEIWAGHGIPLTIVMGNLDPLLWVLGTEPWSSVRAARALNTSTPEMRSQGSWSLWTFHVPVQIYLTCCMQCWCLSYFPWVQIPYGSLDISFPVHTSQGFMSSTQLVVFLAVDVRTTGQQVSIAVSLVSQCVIIISPSVPTSKPAMVGCGATQDRSWMACSWGDCPSVSLWKMCFSHSHIWSVTE